MTKQSGEKGTPGRGKGTARPPSGRDMARSRDKGEATHSGWGAVGQSMRPKMMLTLWRVSRPCRAGNFIFFPKAMRDHWRLFMVRAEVAWQDLPLENKYQSGCSAKDRREWFWSAFWKSAGYRRMLQHPRQKWKRLGFRRWVGTERNE